MTGRGVWRRISDSRIDGETLRPACRAARPPAGPESELRFFQDKALRDAARRLWTSATKRKLYITGSAGAVGRGESFGPDYVLPNGGYAESCAACGMANFAHRMLQLEADADIADELERVLYNSVLHCIALDGKSSYYRNPLSDKNHVRDNNWCCCPPIISRTIMHVGRYAYAHTDKDSTSAARRRSG